jgi:hypothetical protein
MTRHYAINSPSGQGNSRVITAGNLGAWVYNGYPIRPIKTSFSGGGSDENILLENDDELLLENDDNLILE